MKTKIGVELWRHILDFCTEMDLNYQLYGLAAFHGEVPDIF